MKINNIGGPNCNLPAKISGADQALKKLRKIDYLNIRITPGHLLWEWLLDGNCSRGLHFYSAPGEGKAYFRLSDFALGNFLKSKYDELVEINVPSAFNDVELSAFVPSITALQGKFRAIIIHGDQPFVPPIFVGARHLQEIYWIYIAKTKELVDLTQDADLSRLKNVFDEYFKAEFAVPRFLYNFLHFSAEMYIGSIFHGVELGHNSLQKLELAFISNNIRREQVREAIFVPQELFGCKLDFYFVNPNHLFLNMLPPVDEKIFLPVFLMGMEIIKGTVPKEKITPDQFEKIKHLFVDGKELNLRFAPYITREDIDKCEIGDSLKSLLQGQFSYKCNVGSCRGYYDPVENRISAF